MSTTSRSKKPPLSLVATLNDPVHPGVLYGKGFRCAEVVVRPRCYMAGVVPWVRRGARRRFCRARPTSARVAQDLVEYVIGLRSQLLVDPLAESCFVAGSRRLPGGAVAHPRTSCSESLMSRCEETSARPHCLLAGHSATEPWLERCRGWPSLNRPGETSLGALPRTVGTARQTAAFTPQSHRGAGAESRTDRRMVVLHAVRARRDRSRS